MKEEQNEFERLLKEKADRIEMKPSPFVWQHVQHGIQKDRRRRRFAWWLFATGLFATLSTGALFMLDSKLDHPAASSVAENNSDGSNGVANNSSEKNKTETNSSVSSINDQTSAAQNQIADNTPTNNQREKISGNRNKNKKSHTVSSGNSKNDISQRNVISNGEEIMKENEQQEETLVLLPSKEFAFASQENSIHEIPVQTTSFDFSSAPSSKHSFLFEADAMPLASFVWNENTSGTLPQLGLANAALPEGSNSYSFAQGFSTGGNFFLEQNKLWLYGIGLHLTKTHLEAITAQQTITLYDTTYVFDGNTYIPEVVTTDTIVYQSQHNINQWLDVSLMAGVKLFPSSKNHVRILAGAGYSRLLSEQNSNSITPEAYDVAFSTSGGGNTAADSTSTSGLSYYKNQLQLFSEISYQRDLTAKLSFTAGMQFHYYPMNLLNSTELSQNMMWIGLKGGLVFRL